ncbi:unnamed protein product [Rotaria sp. Silwood1]|nr:unnamed protein product [Rotaria sp. Silwood1]CAF3838309.1 unnamed protein product [Rotaria sp. Silwood1]
MFKFYSRITFEKKKKKKVNFHIDEILSDIYIYPFSLLTIVTINIRDRLKAANMKFDRYKFIVQCVIGENRGQGVKYGCRCLWDSDTDGMAEYVYLNDSLFCAVAAFGIFYY